MCGIAGMAGVRNGELLNAMLEVTRHRGPDDWGTYLTDGSSMGNSAGIGNNRLKILDLSSAGHQPMASPDGSIWIAYNGELFNFTELREELIADGCTFRSHADTEVLPLLYQKYGDRMVDHLNGMFAFAIWDKREQRLLVVRDRMGVKPLYYSTIGNKLYFASEAKALLLAPEVSADLDPGALREYLALLYVPNPGTMFRSIKKLQPGCMMNWRNGVASIERYWDSSKAVAQPVLDEKEQIEHCRAVLKDSVRRQLTSDVPVGFFLSGGLDSSAVLACAAEVHGGPLRTYTIAFREDHARMEQCGDDYLYARRMAKQFGADHQEIVVDSDVTSLLTKVIWQMDDAIADHAAIATYLICREAKSTATVLLSGQGADELFAGYRVHLVQRLTRWLSPLPRGVRERLLLAPLEVISRNPGWIPGIKPGLAMAYCRYAKRLLGMAGMSPQNQYIGMRSYLDDTQLEGLLTPEAFSAARPQEDILNEHFRDAANLDFLGQILYVDQQTFLPDLNLAYTDKLSMAASIEARVPFLDNAVVDYARQLPSNMKLHGSTQKYILKKAMEGILPHDLIYRRKAGFGLPVRSWLRNELREMVGDLLSERRVADRGLFRPQAVARMIADNQSGERDATLQLWSLLTLELWQQLWVDQPRTLVLV